MDYTTAQIASIPFNALVAVPVEEVTITNDKQPLRQLMAKTKRLIHEDVQRVYYIYLPGESVDLLRAEFEEMGFNRSRNYSDSNRITFTKYNEEKEEENGEEE